MTNDLAEDMEDPVVAAPFEGDFLMAVVHVEDPGPLGLGFVFTPHFGRLSQDLVVLLGPCIIHKKIDKG